MDNNNKTRANIIIDSSATKPLDPLELSAIIVNIFDYLKDEIKKTPCKFGMGIVKLQKIMWTSYVQYFHKSQKQLVTKDFQAYKYGPILMKVFLEYRNNYYQNDTFEILQNLKAINKNFDGKNIVINSEIAKIIIKNCVRYYDISGYDLSVKSHRGFWKEVYDFEKPGTVLEFDKLKKYYNEVENENNDW